MNFYQLLDEWTSGGRSAVSIAYGDLYGETYYYYLARLCKSSAGAIIAGSPEDGRWLPRKTYTREQGKKRQQPVSARGAAGDSAECRKIQFPPGMQLFPGASK